MVKKISLYFDPYAWDTLHRLVSLLLVSGKALNSLPTMNDVIEGAVSYTAKMIEKDLKQYKFFFRYTQGLSIRNPNLSKPIMNHKDKGRMAFRMSENVKFSIDRIRNVKSFENSEDPNMDLLKGISDAILVRSCIYYLLESPFLLDFLLIMYLSTLFDVSVPSINFRSKSIEEEVSCMTEEAKENLRMILWDEPIILSLTNPNGVADPKNDLTTEYLRNNAVMDLETIKKQGSTPDPAYQSRAFDFNYLTAAVGWLILSYFDISLVTIHELVTNFLDTFRKSIKGDEEEHTLTYVIAIGSFLSALEHALKMSILINDMALSKRANKIDKTKPN